MTPSKDRIEIFRGEDGESGGMSTYISGPMAGYPDFNRGAFHAAHAAIKEMRGMSATIYNPAAVNLGPDATWQDYMREHLPALANTGEVVTLPGWQESRGARLEVHIAHTLGIPVMPLDRWLEAQ